MHTNTTLTLPTMSQTGNSASTPGTGALHGMEVSLKTQRKSDVELVKSCVKLCLFGHIKFLQASQCMVSTRGRSIYYRVANWCGRSADLSWQTAWETYLMALVLKQLSSLRSNKGGGVKKRFWSKCNSSINIHLLLLCLTRFLQCGWPLPPAPGY